MKILMCPATLSHRLKIEKRFKEKIVSTRFFEPAELLRLDLGAVSAADVVYIEWFCRTILPKNATIKVVAGDA